jgi:hypothetical protein
MTNSREEIERTLRSRPWFQATSEELQTRILSLPGELTADERGAKKPDRNCNGFLQHLADRPSECGGVRVVHMRDLLFPDLPGGLMFGLLPVFQVERLDGKASYTYQYFCWRQGVVTGAKGVVLIRGKDGGVSHVICLRGDSFAAGIETFSAIGGFAEVDEISAKKMLLTIQRELDEELGLKDAKIIEVLRLGSIHVDSGMTPSCPELFAVIVDGSEIERMEEDKHSNADLFELTRKIVVARTGALWGPKGLCMRNGDSFFGVCIMRLVALGILKS